MECVLGVLFVVVVMDSVDGFICKYLFVFGDEEWIEMVLMCFLGCVMVCISL